MTFGEKSSKAIKYRKCYCCGKVGYNILLEKLYSVGIRGLAKN